MNAILKAYTLSECMETMAEYVAAYEAKGDYNLIFCEDRLTLIAERALLRKVGGTFRSHVTTFARFLKTDEKALSKQGSVMAVGEVMLRLQNEGKLQCFKSVSGVGNNARSIYETLAQFSASEITPQLLREGVENLPDDMLRKKIVDLAEIYEGYSAFLQEGNFVDESKYLAVLPQSIRQEGMLKGVNVFFLCYTSFTAQARETIRAVMETAANTFGIFCAGEEELYANRAAESFEKVCREYGKYQVRNLGQPLLGEAEILRKGLFNPVRGKDLTSTEHIHLFEADDKTAESEFVATNIRKAMIENGELRYRDFATLTPDVAAYSLPLKKALGEYGIPCFVDEKKSLKRHPVSRFLLDCFRVVKEGYSPVAVQSLTQNFFFGEIVGNGDEKRVAEYDEYRNYLLKFANYRGGAKRPIKDGDAVQGYDKAMLERARTRLLLATENIKARGHGREYCYAVEKIRSDFFVKEKLEILEKSVMDVSQKGYLSQIDDKLDALLEEARKLTADKEMSVAEFEAVLKDGLDATEISLIPLKSDAVFVGDITDSKIEKVGVLFAMGMTDAVPRTATDTAIVSDKEIERLADVKAVLEPTVAEVNLRARESVCLNLCTFFKDLYISYPLGADGSEPAVSDVFRYVDGLFCGADNKKLPRRKHLTQEEFKYKCSAVAPAVRQLLTEKIEYEAKRKDGRELYSTLFTALDKLSVTEKDDYVRLADERKGEQGGQVFVEQGEELFFREGKISPTALESYFACPFSHFASRGLRLQEREEATVLAVDTGNFIHELLQKMAERISELKSEEEARSFAMSEAEKLLKTSVYAMQQDTASGLVFSEKLQKEGADVAVAAYRQIVNSDFSVEKTEGEVDADFYFGKVDRVDASDKYVRVIDYKTGKIDDTPVSYYTGQKIQLELYMSSLKGERIPAGVFYFPASVDYATTTDGRFRMRGFINGDEEALFCGDKGLSRETEKVKSAYFDAALKNDARTKRVMKEDVFRDFLDYSVFVARQGTEELRKGFIAPSPYEGSCKYCKYGGMCGYNKDETRERKEGAVDPNVIANIAKNKKEGE
ncbi:MAG: PD-(D/E)XK nuclease family protein [Clostridia bacterium]|nr:PD-(D/E)XK nuclease family protein [Clostridia bacterium]